MKIPKSIGVTAAPLLLLLLLPLPPGSAYGQQPAEPDAAVDTESDAEQEARALAISRELGQRQAAIEELQSELGIYDQSLIEAYGDLARLYGELEDYENAARLHNDALQIARINSGLFSVEQFAIIAALIENYSALRQGGEVDDLQELNYHINSRLHGPGEPAYLSAVDSYGRWKLRMVRENLLDMSGWNLINSAENLSDFYERVIAAAETAEGVQTEQLLPVLFGKTDVDLALARSIASTPYTAFEGTESRYILRTRCQNVTNNAGQVVRQCYQVQVENPRYRQSQRDAKQFAMNRQTREIVRTIDRLRLIKDSPNGLSNNDRLQLEGQIAQLQTESEQLLRAARRRSLF